MDQARLDYYSFGINCQCFISFYTSDLINCLNRMAKRMSRIETTGPARTGLLSAETYTPSRLCVLGLGIGSADRFGPGFGAFLVQCLLEKCADLIVLPVVFSLPAEVDASAETVLKTMRLSSFEVSGFMAGVMGTTLGMTLLMWHSDSDF
ncbi:hypothetical protein V6N13_065771 [Hibiscus sabdariffa]